MNKEDKFSVNTDKDKERLFWRLLKLSWKYRRGCLKVFAIQVLMLTINLSGLKFAGLGIDYIKWSFDSSGKAPSWPFGLVPPSHWGVMDALLFISLMGIIFALLQYYLNYTDRVVKAKFLQKGIVVDLRSAVYNKMQRLSFRFYDSQTSGTLINRVTGDVQSVRLFIDGVIIQGLVIFISLAVYLTYMFSMNFRLTLACVGSFPVMLCVSYYFSRRLKPAYLRSREMMDDFIMRIAEFISGVHVIKGFAREDYEIRKLQQYNDRVRDQNQKIFWLVSVFHPLIGTLTQLNICILLLYGGYLVVKGEFALGSGLIVFLNLLNRLSDQINASVAIVDNIQQSFAAAGRVFEILDAPITISSPKNPIRIDRAKGAITFKNVYFEYEPGERVLDNISLDIKSGTFVGILGGVGSGKSTLLSLIPRFYDPSMGIVMLDGYDLRKLSLEDLRRQVGIVFQESFLFSNTVAANIAFGVPNANMDQIRRAARIAAAEDFIEHMPKRFDTVIGESGSDLSGGQRQRIAIARAIIFDPPVLLLDDPTAAVDAHTEQEIMKSIEGAMQNRTTILVTNRISALKGADYIYVLQKGRIIQEGTHNQLISQKGYYRKTAEIQEVCEELNLNLSAEELANQHSKGGTK